VKCVVEVCWQRALTGTFFLKHTFNSQLNDSFVTSLHQKYDWGRAPSNFVYIRRFKWCRNNTSIMIFLARYTEINPSKTMDSTSSNICNREKRLRAMTVKFVKWVK
jgi:hypothetical protein